MNLIFKRYGLFGLLSVVLIAFDQWTKSLAYNGLRVNGPIVLIDGVFELLYSENRGAAFGILQGKQWFFLIVAVAVVIVVLLFLYKMPAGKRYYPLFGCMVLLASGAVGNVIDRVSRGFVVDFLYFSLIDFPIFNVADCYVVVSAGLLILLTGFFYKDEEMDFLSMKEK
ncbi:MAG: signal peptidase II [Lachnospiraceae bacterium]|nr:signal peptidase II [Lachnospiraceae bacterium]